MTLPPFPSRATVEAPIIVREGPLCDAASPLLQNGFVGVLLRIDGPMPKSGYAGAPNRRPLLEAFVELGELVQKEWPGTMPELSLESGNRLIFHKTEAAGSHTIYFMGEELSGDHRKSTKRLVRRVVTRLVKTHSLSAPSLRPASFV